MDARRRALARLIACLIGLAAVAGALPRAPVVAQEFERGRHVPGVRLAVGRDAYDITGSTATEIARALEKAAPRSWVRYLRPLFTWSYEAAVIPLVSGLPSEQCRFTELEIVLDFTATYPRWAPPEDVDPELKNAWSAFQDQIERQWARERDEYLVRAEEVVRRSRRYEDRCPLLLQRFHDVVRDVLDRSWPLDGHDTPEPLGLTWPPPGYERLLDSDVEAARTAVQAAARPVKPAEDSAPEAGSGGSRVVAVRPGMPRPYRLPAPDLEFATQTDLRGSRPSGFVAALFHEGTLEYLNAFGTDPETGEALGIDTPLPIPAFTEVLISTLAVALGEAGILDLDAPVAKYLNDVSPGIGRATTRQLLEHRAGLDNAPPRDSTMAWSEVLDRLSDRALATEPGVLASYSNYSFPLAVRVIERATRAPLEDVLQRTLLTPLGMHQTFLGPRDAEEVANGVPIVYTSAADLLRFWYAWLDGSIAGAGSGGVPEADARTLTPDGRTFRGGLWLDRPGALPRLSMVCAAEAADVLVEVFPGSETVLMIMGMDGWPGHTATYMLDALGRTLGIDDEIFGPVPLDGIAGFGRRPRPCDGIETSRVYAPVDFGPRAEAADWTGRYVSGDWFFALEEEEGLLVSPRPEGAPWDIHHFEGDTYFASVPPEEGHGVGFPFRMFHGPDGRRYVMLGDRAYLHEEDRPAR